MHTIGPLSLQVKLSLAGTGRKTKNTLKNRTKFLWLIRNEYTIGKMNNHIITVSKRYTTTIMFGECRVFVSRFGRVSNTKLDEKKTYYFCRKIKQTHTADCTERVLTFKPSKYILFYAPEKKYYNEHYFVVFIVIFILLLFFQG